MKDQPPKDKEKKHPTCFVIMPITTPPALAPAYIGGANHFLHILEYLFRPAVEAAGYECISPNAVGSELIHTGIIENLHTADLVLCDMSVLNANVFFELGIRTALDKPVCIVVDEQVPQIPFDNTILNRHHYDSRLQAWDLKYQIESLTAHIKATKLTGNALWKVFGIREHGQPPKPGSTDEKIALLEQSIAEMAKLLPRGIPSRLRASTFSKTITAHTQLVNLHQIQSILRPFTPDYDQFIYNAAENLVTMNATLFPGVATMEDAKTALESAGFDVMMMMMT